MKVFLHKAVSKLGLSVQQSTKSTKEPVCQNKVKVHLEQCQLLRHDVSVISFDLIVDLI